MESKKINQLATNVAPQTSDLTIIGDPITGVSKKITLLQIANLFATTGTVTSVAVTETGNALTITGSPITSAGTINIGFAGAASQYVRGDGALADFPTSTGGGSSVSYYLNSSVSQGTIGGNAYRQLSKTPVIGAGTDITISANGYVANYITDVNDPALLEVPGGNFNCEFYFSVNSNAHNPYVYAELYKYDGTTFTLLGSSQSIPEYLTNGTTLSAYYFAIPVATAALTITDRLAIRIYVNVDTRTITLHTENSHLCQVVTTFSKGLTSLNNLTRQVQFLATGTSGTDFAISSSTATHTFNLPVASATNTGKLSSTDWSVFNSKEPAITSGTTAQYYRGDKTFQTLNTTAVAEGSNLYYTDARSRAALSFAAGSGAYNSTTGVITIPTNNNQITNGAGYITSSALSAYLPLTGGTLTGALNGTSAVFSSTATATAFIPSGSAIPTNGMYLSAANTLNFATNTANRFTIASDGIATFGTDLYVGRNIYVTDIEAGVNANFYGRYSTGTSVPLAFLYGSTGSVTWNNGGVKMTLTSAGALELVSSLTASSIIKSGGTSSQFLKADGSVDSNTYLTTSSASSTYLPLAGGTLTGQLVINRASGNGLQVASDNVVITAATGFGSPRQLVFTCGNGPTTTLEAKGFGGNYITDFNIKTYNSSGTAFNVFFGTSAGDVGIGTDTPLSKLQVVATGTILRLGEASGTTGKQLLFGVDSATGRGEIQAVWQGTSNTTLALNPIGGNVGIGLTAPKTILQINAGSGAYPTLGTNVTNSFFVGRNDGLIGMYLGYAADGNGWIQQMRNDSATAANLILQPSGGSVGIGTSTPATTLTVYKTRLSSFLTQTPNQLYLQSQGYDGSGYNTIDFGSTSYGVPLARIGVGIFGDGSYMSFGTSNSYATGITNQAMTITSGGNVGIGNTGLSNTRLKVSGVDDTSSNFALNISNSTSDAFTIRNDGLFNTSTLPNSPYNYSTSGRSAVIQSNGFLGYLVSTRESKANIKTIENIDFINKLNPVQFNYRKKDDKTNVFTDKVYDNLTYGFIADEVELINKELVMYNADGTLGGVEYNSIIAILTKAVQEQTQIIKELEARIKQLENK